MAHFGFQYGVFTGKRADVHRFTRSRCHIDIGGKGGGGVGRRGRTEEEGEGKDIKV